MDGADERAEADVRGGSGGEGRGPTGDESDLYHSNYETSDDDYGANRGRQS